MAIIKPEKVGIVVCREKANHTDQPADIFVIYLFVDGDMYEEPPWQFVESILQDRPIGVSYGKCKECK